MEFATLDDIHETLVILWSNRGFDDGEDLYQVLLPIFESLIADAKLKVLLDLADQEYVLNGFTLALERILKFAEEFRGE